MVRYTPSTNRSQLSPRKKSTKVRSTTPSINRDQLSPRKKSDIPKKLEINHDDTKQKILNDIDLSQILKSAGKSVP